ncbi:hypothetical protein HYE68_008939 [Fusarium pseudograminearum]|nr:hypothetical protein HYE68_008939 [Fusarium pseudograminearum]
MAAEPDISLPIFRLKETTRINVERILRCPKESPARVILLVGRSGAGKSSIAEHATDTAGYRNNTKTLSTTDCEVLQTTIDGTEWFFIDTPGFDNDESAVRTFERISVLLNTINKHAVLVGLWYVVGNPSSTEIPRRNTTDSVSSAETQGRLRMFLFETPLSFEDFNPSNSSTSHLYPFSDISSNDTSDLSEITSLPGIPSTPFKFISHLGIVAIRDEVFTDKALSLRDKLATGKIYEHPGPYLKQSNDAFGRPVDTTFLNNITALDFVAYSNMDDAELDVLVQQLISVHGILHLRPVCHPIFWNSHDVACRFAYIAATPTSDLSRLRQLSTTFERAKFAFIREPKPKLSPIFIYSFFAKFLRLHNSPRYLYNNQNSVMTRHASEGKMFAEMVKLRFPILRFLNEVTEEEWNDLIFDCKISVWRWLQGGGSIRRTRARAKAKWGDVRNEAELNAPPRAI